MLRDRAIEVGGIEINTGNENETVIESTSHPQENTALTDHIATTDHEVGTETETVRETENIVADTVVVAPKISSPFPNKQRKKTSKLQLKQKILPADRQSSPTAQAASKSKAPVTDAKAALSMRLSSRLDRVVTVLVIVAMTNRAEGTITVNRKATTLLRDIEIPIRGLHERRKVRGKSRRLQERRSLLVLHRRLKILIPLNVKPEIERDC